MWGRLQDVEEKQDFYAGLYRQYSYNLLKLTIYVRSLLSNERVHVFLREHHPDLLNTFQEIIDTVIVILMSDAEIQRREVIRLILSLEREGKG